MGNSHPIIALDNFRGSVGFPFHLKLGRNATIDMSKRVVEDCGLFAENMEEYWSVSYTVDGSTCNFTLERLVGLDGSVDYAKIKLRDDGIYLNRDWLQFTIHKYLPGYLSISIYPHIAWTKRNSTVDAFGDVVDMKIYLYGSGSRGGLLVCECKKSSVKKNDEEAASAMTVTHYYTSGSGTVFNQTETDIGLSVVAKIQISNGNMDITVEGPQQHPTSALFYMFDQVNRTGIWKHTMCPHCANIRRGRMFWQSDSEDNHSVPLVPRPSSQQNATSIASGGRFRGIGSGSSIIGRYVSKFMSL